MTISAVFRETILIDWMIYWLFLFIFQFSFYFCSHLSSLCCASRRHKWRKIVVEIEFRKNQNKNIGKYNNWIDEKTKNYSIIQSGTTSSSLNDSGWTDVYCSLYKLYCTIANEIYTIMNRWYRHLLLGWTLKWTFLFSIYDAILKERDVRTLSLYYILSSWFSSFYNFFAHRRQCRVE